MNTSRDFKKEYDAFLAKVPYQTAVVDNVKVRYQYGGKNGAPVILFFNGLEMQEIRTTRAKALPLRFVMHWSPLQREKRSLPTRLSQQNHFFNTEDIA